MKRILLILVVLSMALCIVSGCQNSSVPSGDMNENFSIADSDSSSDDISSSASVQAEFSQTASDMFTDRDYEVGFDQNGAVTINFSGDSVGCSSDSVKISGTTVTITQEATYILSGTLDNGMVIVDAGETDKLQLVLNGVNINSETSAALYILEGDKVFVTLAQGTSNVLSNGGTFTAIDENNIDATVFSKQDITFNGAGELSVSSPVGHGVVSKDDLVITSGTYTINSASHGLDANDSVRIANADIKINSGKDGIHSENSEDASVGFVYILSGNMNIDAEGDGVSAEAYMKIEGGTFNVVSGGGSVNASKQTSDFYGGFMGGRPGQFGAVAPESDVTDESGTSIKGFKSAGSMLINNGNITINSADDAIHSNSSITVNGGSFEISTGDDAFHADESLSIASGVINVTESYEGLEALDIVVSGGDIKLVSSDDGLNAAGGTDSSGFGGERGNDKFGGRGGMGGMGGMGGTSSSNGSIVISGGKLYVNASGDGIDANGTLTISGGYTVVCGPTQGDTATLDYDISAVITGGTFIGTGASGMAQTFSDSEQGLLSLSVGNQSAGTTVTLTNSAGDTIISYAPDLPFAVLIVSTPEIISGESYTVTVGSESADFTAS